MISKEQLLEFVKGEIPETLTGIVFRVIKGLIEGKKPEDLITRAERELLADYAQRRLDRALGEKPKGGPVPGSGV